MVACPDTTIWAQSLAFVTRDLWIHSVCADCEPKKAGVQVCLLGREEPSEVVMCPHESCFVRGPLVSALG